MTAIQGTCSEYCGGWNYVFRNLEFINGDQHLGMFDNEFDLFCCIAVASTDSSVTSLEEATLIQAKFIKL